jgi:hypothetical protein
MDKSTRYVGLDVHGETIAAALAGGRGEVRSLEVGSPTGPRRSGSLSNSLAGPGT